MFVFNDTSKLLIYFLSAVIVLFYVNFFYVNRRIFKFAWKNDGFFLPILPLLGTTYISLFTGEKINLLGLAHWIIKYIGSKVNFWVGHTYNYVTTDVREIKILLKHPKCLNKSTLYNDLKPTFGASSLLLIEQEAWKGRRKHFLKSFKPAILKSFVNQFYTYSTKLVDDLKKLDGAVVPINYLNSSVFNTFCVTAFGLDHQKLEKELAEYGSLRQKINEAIAEKLVNPLLPYSWWTNYFQNGKKAAEYMKRSRVILEKIIKEKRIALERNQDYIENSSEVPLLDLILCYDNQIMSDERIFDEIGLMATAAVETSSNALYLGFAILGMHPDVQEKMYTEVTNEIGDTDDITTQNIGNLKYTEAVICEILRLVPSIPFIGRTAEEDVDLGNNKIVPKGVDVAISVFYLHRVETYWKDPNKFDPSRFFPENADKIVPYSYIPFSAGPRDCIGRQYSMTSLKITFANILRNFRIATNHKSIDEFNLCSAVTLYPSNPLDLRFISRENT